jgi:hypothetical protein
VKVFEEVTVMSADSMAQSTQNSSHEEISVRAYHLWEERGRPVGSPDEDWSRAETEIRGEEAVQERLALFRNEEARDHRRRQADDLPPFTDFSAGL